MLLIEFDRTAAALQKTKSAAIHHIYAMLANSGALRHFMQRNFSQIEKAVNVS
jgi:hypothetical protein